jgi:antitoxin component YwqK of YwqJK toxin-antitoxin module
MAGSVLRVVFHAGCGLAVCLGGVIARADDDSRLALAGSGAYGAAAQGAAETVTETYPDGTPHVVCPVIKDAEGNLVSHGTYVEYDRRRAVVRRGEYRLGKQEGLWVRVFDAGEGSLFSDELDSQFPGPFLSEATFNDGQLNGVWTITSSARRKIVELHFENGVRQGISTWWYPGGEKRREITYRDGKPVGELREFDEQGNLAGRAAFLDGRMLVRKIQRYPSGEKRHEGWVLRSPSQGEPLFDWWNGTAQATPAIDGRAEQKHGQWTAWYRNGQKQTEGEYAEGQAVGTFTWWYENGQKQAEGAYVDGREQGTWTTWHPQGQKQSQDLYVAGVLQGQGLSWNPAGQLIETPDLAGAGPRGTARQTR